MEQYVFGPLLPYIQDEKVTDIDYNGHELWVTHLDKGRFAVKDVKLTGEFLAQFSHHVANYCGQPFNRMHNLLETEMENLRISIIHESVAVSGRSISIRKALPKVRMTEETIVAQGYCQPQVLYLLANCVRARMNFVFCGEPGVGKTECAKFFSRYIAGGERVITIEDNLELHYRSINPGKDCVELKVDACDFDYSKAIKACLRQNPRWIMLSEARSREVKYLLESWSTGVCGFTTLHVDDVRKIPDRIQNMMGVAVDAERLENDIYEFVNVGVLLRRKQDAVGRSIRYIDQVCFFIRSENKNRIAMMVEEGRLVNAKIPEEIRKKMERAGIRNPFEPFES